MLICLTLQANNSGWDLPVSSTIRSVTHTPWCYRQILVLKPLFAIMDEATSALDIKLEVRTLLTVVLLSF